MEQRKEITKEKYKLIVYGCLIIGTLLFMAMAYISNFLVQPNSYYIAYMSVGILILGFGVGLGYARVWKIKGIDN